MTGIDELLGGAASRSAPEPQAFAGEAELVDPEDVLVTTGGLTVTFAFTGGGTCHGTLGAGTQAGDRCSTPDNSTGTAAAPSLDLGLSWKSFREVEAALIDFDAWLTEHDARYQWADEYLRQRDPVLAGRLVVAGSVIVVAAGTYGFVQRVFLTGEA